MDFVIGQVIVTKNNKFQEKQIRNESCKELKGCKVALNKRYFRMSKALKP